MLGAHACTYTETDIMNISLAYKILMHIILQWSGVDEMQTQTSRRPNSSVLRYTFSTESRIDINLHTVMMELHYQR